MQVNLNSRIVSSVSLSFILLTPLVGQVQQKNINCCGLPVGSIVTRSAPSTTTRSVNVSSFTNQKPVLRVSNVTPVSPNLTKPRAISSPPAFRQSSAVSRLVSTRTGFTSGGVGARSLPCPPKTGSSNGSFSSTPSPLTVYYVERQIKSIRVSSIPDIERWENGLRKNMALNGRNRVRVNELLGRIRHHYQNEDIQAEDYSPAGKGYVPSEATRKFAESRITRTVQSMAEYFTNSGNREMDSSRSARGDSFLKGKLSFVNTELDKIGKPRITLDELKEAISMNINGPVPQPERIEAPVNLPEEIANELPVLDENIIKQRVKARYLAFAEWLASKEKAFPSLDPEVDKKTMETFDLVNAELRGIGKFESMQIFREKTIAYLEDVLDGEIIPQAAPPPAPQAAPLVAERLRIGLPTEAEERLEVDVRPELLFRPVRNSLPSAFKPSGLPIFSSPVLPGNPLDASPRRKFEDASGGSFSPASERSLPGKSWTPVRKRAPSSSAFEIRKLGSLPGTPI
jgi:hypothetical protein